MRISALRIISTANAPLLDLSSLRFKPLFLGCTHFFRCLQVPRKPDWPHTGDLIDSHPCVPARPESQKGLTASEFSYHVESTLRLHTAPDTELPADQSPLLPPLEEGDERAKKGERHFFSFS
jgi:hypothetical protein